MTVTGDACLRRLLTVVREVTVIRRLLAKCVTRRIRVEL